MKKDSIAMGIPQNTKPPNLGQFRNDLAGRRCNVGSHINGNKRDRPSIGSLEQSLQANKCREPSHPLPSMDVRKDGIAH